jgi:hypothetical protein
MADILLRVAVSARLDVRKGESMVTGTCLCGGVVFAIDGVLSPMQYCHATRCRKASGSAFAAELVALASTFRWVRGEDFVTTYEAPLLREPPPYRRSFCRVCGSPLPVALEGTDFVVLHAGVLDGEPETRPFRHIFVAQQAPWHMITDDMPQFEEHDSTDQQVLRRKRATGQRSLRFGKGAGA